MELGYLYQKRRKEWISLSSQANNEPLKNSVPSVEPSLLSECSWLPIPPE